MDFGGDKAVEVTDYLIDLAANPNFKIDADGSGIAGLRDGNISAMFSGSWDANGVKEALGKNMGAASLPPTLNGEGKADDGNAGSKAVGVNPTANIWCPQWNCAIYLGSAQASAQPLRTQKRDSMYTKLMEEKESCLTRLLWREQYLPSIPRFSSPLYRR